MSHKRKVTSTDSKESLSKRADTEKEWISATSVANYLLEDQLSDWLKLYGETEENVSPMLKYLFQQGHTFESRIVDNIRQKIGSNKVVFISQRYNKALVNRTLAEMRKGTPVIHSASLASESLRIYGVSDLLIRSDYMNRLVPDTLDEKEETQGCAMHPNFHYRVIDVKYSTLPLRADGKGVLNQDRYRAYKGQLWIYNKILAELQGYDPEKAYILGRKYSYISRGEKHRGSSAFLRLGEIDYSDWDAPYNDRTETAIAWVRSLRREGREWTCEEHPELYPNMKADSMCQKEKEEIANEIGEITQLWFCGVTQREMALAKGISSWRNPKFCSTVVEMKGQRGDTLDQILHVNRDPQLLYLPQKLKKTNAFFKKNVKEFFVDFETIGGAFDDLNRLPEANPLDIIFMISVGWTYVEIDLDTGEESTYWKCSTYTVNSLSHQEERRILDSFLQLVGTEVESGSELYHWSDAEPLIFEAACRRHQLDNVLRNRWTDLLWLFREEPITVKGCLGYSIKEIVRALQTQGLIDFSWDSSDINGELAMLQAYNEYAKGHSVNSPVIQSIIKYNQDDCEALWRVIQFVREKMMDSE